MTIIIIRAAVNFWNWLNVWFSKFARNEKKINITRIILLYDVYVRWHLMNNYSWIGRPVQASAHHFVMDPNYFCMGCCYLRNCVWHKLICLERHILISTISMASNLAKVRAYKSTRVNSTLLCDFRYKCVNIADINHHMKQTNLKFISQSIERNNNKNTVHAPCVVRLRLSQYWIAALHIHIFVRSLFFLICCCCCCLFCIKIEQQSESIKQKPLRCSHANRNQSKFDFL